MPEAKSRDALLVVLMVASMVAWGGSWPSAKLIADKAAPEVIVFWRFLLTTLVFIPLVAATRSPLRLPARSLALTVAAGALLALYNWLFFAGLRRGLAGAGGVIAPTLNPIFTYAISIPLQKRRPGPAGIAGLALGLAGGLVFIRVWRIGPGDLLLTGNLFFVAAALCWSVVTLLSQRIQRDVPFMSYSFLAYAVATVLDFGLAVRAGGLSLSGLTAASDAVFWINVAYLGIVATAFATTVYFLSSSRLGSRRASAFMFMIPAAALFLSWLILGEVPAAATLAGGALSVSAVYLVNREESARRRAPAG